MAKEFTHLDGEGMPCMVDVTPKVVSFRVAEATGSILMAASTIEAVRENRVKKGNVLAVAVVAGIQAAKQTSSLIPLCHPLPLTRVDVVPRVEDDRIVVNATVACSSQTGVEMEALTAVSVALLTIYDMCKALDKGMEMVGVRLVSKSKTPLGQ